MDTSSDHFDIINTLPHSVTHSSTQPHTQLHSQSTTRLKGTGCNFPTRGDGEMGNIIRASPLSIRGCCCRWLLDGLRKDEVQYMQILLHVHSLHLSHSLIWRLCYHRRCPATVTPPLCFTNSPTEWLKPVTTGLRYGLVVSHGQGIQCTGFIKWPTLNIIWIMILISHFPCPSPKITLPQS